MSRRSLLPLMGLIIVLLAGARSPLAAYPEPAIVSPSWNLDFTFETPRLIAVEDITGTVHWYWYMVYEVTNQTGEDQLFIPEVTIATDTGRIIEAGRGVPAAVFARIKERLGDPLLESPIQIVGRLLQGVDYARKSVTIWPAFEQDVDEFTMFFSGLSGETQTIAHPATGEPVLMRRTLMIRFSLPGTPANPQQQKALLQEQREVMR